jgi:hypothetical protein
MLETNFPSRGNPAKQRRPVGRALQPQPGQRSKAISYQVNNQIRNYPVLVSMVMLIAMSNVQAETAQHQHMLVDKLPGMLDHPHQPYLNWGPGSEYSDSERMWQGIPSVAVAPGGKRLWATWYGGGEGEGPHNYILLATSGDGGETWSEVLATIDPPFRASEPAVWVDPAPA